MPAGWRIHDPHPNGLGLEAQATARDDSEAIALVEAQICRIPLSVLRHLSWTARCWRAAATAHQTSTTQCRGQAGSRPSSGHGLRRQALQSHHPTPDPIPALNRHQCLLGSASAAGLGMAAALLLWPLLATMRRL